MLFGLQADDGGRPATFTVVAKKETTLFCEGATIELTVGFPWLTFPQGSDELIIHRAEAVVAATAGYRQKQQGRAVDVPRS